MKHNKDNPGQAGAELGQAQLKLELELSFTWFKICCIKLINKNLATLTATSMYFVDNK